MTSSSLSRRRAPTRTVIETGTGQGFLTRRIENGCATTSASSATSHTLNGELRSPRWSSSTGSDACSHPTKAPTTKRWRPRACACWTRTLRFEYTEIQRWWRRARPGAAVFVHDAGNGHGDDTPHALVRATIIELGIPGIFLDNPRGAFVGQKPPVGGRSSVATGTYVANRLVELEARLPHATGDEDVPLHGRRSARVRRAEEAAVGSLSPPVSRADDQRLHGGDRSVRRQTGSEGQCVARGGLDTGTSTALASSGPGRARRPRVQTTEATQRICVR